MTLVSFGRLQMELSLSLLDRTSSTDKPKIEALNATLDVLKSTIREVSFELLFFVKISFVQASAMN